VAVFKDTHTGIVGANNHSPLQAYAQNGTLYVSGLTTGSTIYVYNTLGTLVYQTTPNPSGEGELTIPLPGRGVYIVTDGSSVVKVANIFVPF
jgi:hypothetical protein